MRAIIASTTAGPLIVYPEDELWEKLEPLSRIFGLANLSDPEHVSLLYPEFDVSVLFGKNRVIEKLNDLADAYRMLDETWEETGSWSFRERMSSIEESYKLVLETLVYVYSTEEALNLSKRIQEILPPEPESYYQNFSGYSRLLVQQAILEKVLNVKGVSHDSDSGKKSSSAWVRAQKLLGF